MKKTFPLTESSHKPARVVDQVRHDINKYIKRERGKTLPEGFDFWDFDCRSGKDADSATSVHLSKLSDSLTPAVAEQWPSVYVEILAKPRKRVSKK